nr:TonB-dependent siderophore receptor [uncultured Dongia sp.]
MGQRGWARSTAQQPARSRGRNFNLNLALLLGGAAIAGAGHAQAEEATPGTDWQKRLSEISGGDALRIDSFMTQVAQAGGTADFNIPAQPLGQALIAFSKATGIAVIADSTLLDGLSSAPVVGTMAPDQALQALLANTGIGFRPTSDNAVTLQKVAAGGAGDSQELAPLTVEDTAEATPPLSDGYQPLLSGTTKNTQPLLDTPKTVVVVTEKQMEDRGITDLKQALRTVPGVTMNQGEGGTRGTNFRIRGFDGNRSDNYVDGVRDPTVGSFKDTFNYEQIEVNKGPASSVGGRGSASGSINSVTKTPKAESFYNLDGSLGTDNTKRVVLDVNQAVPEEYTSIDGVAFRLNGVWHDSEVAGRDVTESERWGIAPSLTVGLGEPLTATITYMHAESDNIPDYGLPTVNNEVKEEYRHNFYPQRNVIQENSNVDVVGLNLQYEANDWLTLRNQTRAQWSEVFSIAGHVRTDSSGAVFPLVNTNHGARTYEDEFYNNQTMADLDFSTGPLDHEAIVGFDIAREKRYVQNYRLAFKTKNGDWVTAVPNVSINHPDNNFITDYAISATTHTSYVSDTKAVYGYDTVSFLDDMFEVNGGLRYEWINSSTVQSLGRDASNTGEYLSWQAGLVYHPVEYGSIYFGYGQSFTPQDADLAVSTTIPQDQAEALETTTYEIGTKWNLFDEKLSVTAAVFQTDKDGQLLNNGTTTDPDYVVTGKQRVRGVELGVSGEVTDGWNVAGGYTYMKGKILEEASTNDAAVFRNMPEHALSLWTSYDLPWWNRDVTVGAGATYMGTRKYLFGASDEKNIDSYWVFDLMGQYRLTENIEFQFNLYNLTDEFYVDQVGGGFVTPGAGRSALFTTALKF